MPATGKTAFLTRMGGSCFILHSRDPIARNGRQGQRGRLDQSAA
jgi:hypothetical protein